MTENVARTQIAVSGDGLGSTRPTLSIAGVSLPVLSSTNGSVTAQIPAGTAPGSYLLTVQNNNSHLAGIFAVVL